MTSKSSVTVFISTLLVVDSRSDFPVSTRISRRHGVPTGVRASARLGNEERNKQVSRGSNFIS